MITPYTIITCYGNYSILIIETEYSLQLFDNSLCSNCDKNHNRLLHHPIHFYNGNVIPIITILKAILKVKVYLTTSKCFYSSD